MGKPKSQQGFPAGSRAVWLKEAKKSREKEGGERMPPNPGPVGLVDEKEKVALKISQKVESFLKEFNRIYKSLPDNWGGKLLLKEASSLREWGEETSKTKIGNFYCQIQMLWGSDSSMIVICNSEESGCYPNFYRLDMPDFICQFFNSINSINEESIWIRGGVWLEEQVEKIIAKTREIYKEYLSRFPPPVYALHQRLLAQLEMNEALERGYESLRQLLRDEISFLNKTKGIFKSRGIAERRQYLEAVLRRHP